MQKATDVYDMADDISHCRLPLWIAVARGLALFLGAFSLLNIVGELRHSGFDANLWWIDLRVLAVSHFYHLPRIKLAYQRCGREVYTVPAQETHRLRALPVYMLREIAALLVYYVRPLA